MKSQTAGQVDLRQHFHNYFELLLGMERSKLQQAISSVNVAERAALLAEIDCRIHYLRGAVKMGKLLCLIDQEEAKTNFGMLSAERERLRAVALDDHARDYKESSVSSRITAIRQSLQPQAPVTSP